MILPFGLKQKPLPHYFEHGVIRFTNKEGKLYFTAKHITKKTGFTLYHLTPVRDKVHLDKLLTVKSLSDIQSLEVVN